MFDSLHGTMRHRDPTRIVVDVGGLGYALSVSLSTFERLPAPGEAVDLLVHLIVREDEWRLFGFATEGERDVFRALLKVTGVGPMIALGLLSGLEPRELKDAVTSGDVRALTRVKGVGKKTAERIVVELRDVLAKGGTGPGVGGVPLPEGPAGDAVAALVVLGMDPGDAHRRVASALGKTPDAAVSDLVRAALRG